MTSRPRRARDVRALARELSERAGVRVEATYHGGGADAWGGWHLWWSGGPSCAEMRSIAEDRGMDRHPEAQPGSLRFDRSLNDEHAAALLLAWMAQNPDDAATALLLDDGELPGYPERQPAAIRRRAATLIAAGWRAHTAGAAAAELARRVRTGGWPEVCAWLDELGAQQDAPVIALRPIPSSDDKR